RHRRHGAVYGSVPAALLALIEWPPHRQYHPGNCAMMSLSILLLFLFIMLMGVPIAIAMSVSAGIVIWWHGLPLSVLAQRMVNSLDSTPLLAVPMFIFAACLFNASGITGHLFDLVRLLVGRIRGGLGQVSVLTSLIFSGMSGAALADIGALGGTQMR